MLHSLKLAFNKFLKDSCPAYAATLTYATILSLVPLATISFSLIGHFKLSPAKIRSFLLNYFLPESNLVPIIEQNIEKFIANTAALSIISSIILIFIAFMVLSVIEAIFNHIWHVKKRRPLLNKFVSFWTVLTLSPLLLGASLGFIAKIQHFSFSPVIISVILNILAMALLYRLFPYTEVSFKAALIGSIFASLLFELGKWAFRYYIHYYANFEKIYGALSVIPIFLVWVYWVWNIVLFGAEITFILDYPYIPEQSEHYFNPLWPVLLLYLLLSNFHQDKKRLTIRELAQKLDIPLPKLYFLIQEFEKQGIITETPKGEFLPNTPLERLSIKEIVFCPLRFSSKLHNKTPAQFEELAQKFQACLKKEWGELTLGDLLER